MDQRAVVSVLCSWAGWASGKVGPLPPSCASIESRYRPPAGSVFDDSPRPRAARISDDRGAQIDAAVARSGHQRLLVAVFLRELSAHSACRALGLVGDPSLLVGAAVRAVGDRLDPR